MNFKYIKTTTLAYVYRNTENKTRDKGNEA
jgi:hypothetical protein